MPKLRQSCINYDLQLAMNRATLDMDRLMQLELNELMPEQTQLLMDHQRKEEERAREHQK